MKTQNVALEQDDFLKILSEYTPEQLNELIKKNGKKSKGVPLITIFHE